MNLAVTVCSSNPNIQITLTISLYYYSFSEALKRTEELKLVSNLCTVVVSWVQQVLKKEDLRRNLDERHFVGTRMHDLDDLLSRAARHLAALNHTNKYSNLLDQFLCCCKHLSFVNS